MDSNRLFLKLPYRLFINLARTYGSEEAKQMVVRKQDYLVTKLDEKLVGFPGAIGLAEMQVLVVWNPAPEGLYGQSVEELEPVPAFIMSSTPLEGFDGLPLEHGRFAGPRVWISQPTQWERTGDGKQRHYVNPALKFVGQIITEEVSLLDAEPELGQAAY